MQRATTETVAIIGGGASGALTAYHLLKKDAPAHVVIIDPRAEVGLGVAYSTRCRCHLLNVPAGKISALPDQPDHFLSWLRFNEDAKATYATFAPREAFGRYLQSLLAEVPNLETLRATVVDYHFSNSKAVLKLSDGRVVRADFVVLATGNLEPARVPGVSKEAETNGVFCRDAWAVSSCANLDPNATVTLIGTGLTAVDMVLRLREGGFRGVITAVSRHGIPPRGHAPYVSLEESAVPRGVSATSIAYLRCFRAKIQGGADWRAAVDSLRTTENDLWSALTLKEQERFQRHLQRRWDVVRHRTAPPVFDAIDTELKAGTLVIRKGRVTAVDVAGSGAVVTIRTASGLETFTTTRVINCAGSNMNYRAVDSPLFRSLFTQGLVSAGRHGKGFLCAGNGAVIDARGRVSTMLFNLGPGRQGTLFESIAIPEIRCQAAQLAKTLSEQLMQEDVGDEVSR